MEGSRNVLICLFAYFRKKSSESIKKNGNQMQNLSCRNVLNVKFPKIVAEKFAYYTKVIVPFS